MEVHCLICTTTPNQTNLDFIKDGPKINSSPAPLAFFHSADNKCFIEELKPNASKKFKIDYHALKMELVHLWHPFAH